MFVENIRNSRFLNYMEEITWNYWKETNELMWFTVGCSGDCLLARIWAFLLHKRREMSPIAKV